MNILQNDDDNGDDQNPVQPEEGAELEDDEDEEDDGLGVDTDDEDDEEDFE